MRWRRWGVVLAVGVLVAVVLGSCGGRDTIEDLEADRVWVREAAMEVMPALADQLGGEITECWGAYSVSGLKGHDRRFYEVEMRFRVTPQEPEAFTAAFEMLGFEIIQDVVRGRGTIVGERDDGLKLIMFVGDASRQAVTLKSPIRSMVSDAPVSKPPGREVLELD